MTMFSVADSKTVLQQDRRKFHNAQPVGAVILCLS